ncbi:MAG TPA: DUF1583 domain-containing protein [Planctomycetaceae bacterium]|nr:DUF1583 domain-containing protein [Planctomycetaceae bacterium]
MNPLRRIAYPLLIVAATALWTSPAAAQFDFLQSLFGPRRAAPRVFAGDAQLNDAHAAAVRGDIAASLELTRTAMAKGAAQVPLNDSIGNMVAAKLVALSKVWDEHEANADDVAAVLQEIVLPVGKPREFWPYPVPWQPEIRAWTPHENRLPKPQSVAAELIRWTARANQFDRLANRLQTADASTHPLVDVMRVQVAIARDQADAATPLLTDLKSSFNPKSGSHEWWLHAVSAGVQLEQSRPAALELLETVLSDGQSLAQTSLAESRFTLQLLAVQLYFDLGRPEDAVRLARASLEDTASAQRFGTEMAAHVQQMRRSQIASALLAGHYVEEALTLLTARADAPFARYEMYYPSPNVAARLGRELAALPAEQRFNLLRNWTLPPEATDRFRDLSEFVPEHIVMANASDEDSADPIPTAGLLHDVYSTSWHLLTTARELNRLDELIADLAHLPSNNADNLALQTLALVVRDADSADGGRRAQLMQRLQTLLEVTAANVPKWEDNPRRPLSMMTCVAALEAASHPELSVITPDLLMRLIEHTQRLQWDRPRSHLRLAWAETLRRRSTAVTQQNAASHKTATIPTVWQDLRPKHWITSGLESAQQQAGGSLTDVWIAHEETIEHLIGRYDSTLFFEVPLTGDFELSAEVREGGWAEGGTGYGGIVFATNGYSDAAPLHAPGRTHYTWGPTLPNVLHRNPWNRQRLDARDGVARYYANGQLIHEDHAGVSAPWLCLNADWGRTPVYRNLRFIGTPTIPREVPLLTDHRLRGWVSNFYSETREDPLRPTPQSGRLLVSRDALAFPISTDGEATTGPREVMIATDWYLTGNELRSPRRDSILSTSVPSHFRYYRPLQPGETISYEFFAKAGEVMTHPTIGRMRIELSTEGVQLRPITAGDSEVRLIQQVKTELRNPLKIEDNTWNRIALTMRDDHVELLVNDNEPLPVPLPEPREREFGFWHDASVSAVRVRDIVLRGPWPEKFTAEHQAAIERPQAANPPPGKSFANALLQESILADNAYGVYQRALQLEGEARYQYLYRWVMPGPDHSTLRTTGALTPTHPSPLAIAENPIDVATAEVRQQKDGRRVQTGGSFVCPAVLLSFSALELGRLGELSDALDQPVEAPTPAFIRARAAMHGLIALLEDRIDQSKAALWECNQLLLEGGKLEQHERWSEPALCSLAVLHPDTREIAFELLDRIQRRQLQSGQPGSNEFNRYVRQLHGQAHYLLQGGDPDAFGTYPGLKQWQSVSQPCARTRGAGAPVAAFDDLDREWSLRGGHDFDMAYFQSPLQGDFEIRARLTQFDYRELMPLVGGIASVVRFDGKSKKLLSIRTSIREVPLEEEHVRKARAWGDYHIIVKDGRYTAFVNSQKLHEQDLPAHRDPWIAIQGWGGQSSRAARNVVITGTPEIPRELDLLAPPDLQGWLADYYGSTTGETPYTWSREQDELVCPQTVVRGATPGRLKIENILRYHRPMLENGEISYEFYYDPDAKVAEPRDNQRASFPGQNPTVNWLPGQIVVHPALDRMVCLMEPDGVKIHWLTDGRYDRTGVSPANVTAVNSSKPLPLKKQDWNAVRFQVRGDELSIVLNGDEVFSHAIEPTNQRHFGFFHYVNESTARVRQVRYRGEWPRELPAVADQELAEGPEKNLHNVEATLPARLEYDMTKTSLDPQKFGYLWDAKISRFLKATPQGLKMTFPAGEQKGATVAGFTPRARIKGDFVATLDYEQLKTTPVKEAWGSGLSFKFKMNASYEAGFEVRRTTTGMSLNCAWNMPTAAKSTVYYSEGFSEYPTEGRLRLIRRGVMVYFLMAAPGSDDFRLLTSRPLGTTDIDRIGAQVDCSDAAGGAEVLITRIDIHAQELVPPK